MIHPSSCQRSGGVAVIAVLMMIPLLLLVAFAIDFNSIWRTDAELQQAADAAALAGATRLLDANRASQQLGILGSLLSLLENSSQSDAVTTAQHQVSLHQAGGAKLILNASDVQFGYIADPTAKPDTPQGAWQTGRGAPSPNSVQVTVRRDSTVSSGPLTLFFGGIFGVPTVSRQATATATLRNQTITGFQGTPCKLLPIAIDQATCNWMRGVPGPAPAGCLSQDLFTVRAPICSGLLPSLNVLPGPDGLIEADVLLAAVTPGNFGLVSLRNSADTVNADYQNWIRNGPSLADLSSFGAQGLQATPRRR
jgi:Flp pilus assembly protein TadG